MGAVRVCVGVVCGAIALAALSVAMATPAAAAEAESFVQDYIQRGLAILNDKSLSHDEKHKQFVALLDPITDMRRVALYALGPVAKTAPAEQVAAFASAFHDLEISLYERELWRVQNMKVEHSIERAKGDTIVQAFRLDDDGTRSVIADEIDFRVLSDADKPIIVDFCVMGAWVAVNQKVQYGEFLEERGNDLPKLTRKVLNRASKMNRYLAAGEVEPPPVKKARTR